MSSFFIPLNTHSHYSLLAALPKIPDLVAKAKKVGMEALALTDNGNLYGAIEFYKECKKEGIKPILGIDCYLAARTRHDKVGGIDNRRTRLILLAENELGYKNLIKLSTAAHLEGFYYKPRADFELLEKYNGGLIAIVPFGASEVATALRIKDKERAKAFLVRLLGIFGTERLRLGIGSEKTTADAAVLLPMIQELSATLAIPLVAVEPVFYLEQEDKPARDTMLLVSAGGALGEREVEGNQDYSFVSAEEAVRRFAHIPVALAETARIAERCNLELTLGTWVFPIIDTGGVAPDEAFRKTVEAGYARRNIQKTQETEKRVAYELEIIARKGYAPYFLVVADLLRFAHERGILTTIRGSVAGSLSTFLAGITNVNPLEYKLPFERFLNPERPSAPDIDMDFADNRRDEMIEYAKQKYGADKVAQIGTFGTMMARGSVRDVARAMGFDYALGDRIAKLIPFGSQGFPMSIERALELVPELAKLYKDDDDTKQIIDMAKKIEGCARHISVHAAGVVIAPTPLTDYAPLQLDPKGGKLITQYDMYAVEEAGLLKFDFLGIKNLSILADAVARAKELEGVTIDIENIPIDDRKTFEMLARGETGGLFQLNGAGMTRYLKELKPTSILDINAMVALYRPGPMETIPQYIERKHNPRLITYLDPRLKDILADSYGVITYQDDVLLTAITLGGYSWLEADKLRKAMGKKIPAEMEAQRVKLIEGFIKNGTTKEKAEQLWRLIEPFAAYGFNKAHAASYGKVAYQTAYMKANFPAIYMAAVLTADSGDVEKIGETVADCKRMNILVLPPSINESFSGFTMVKDVGVDKIRFGLTTIKNFGEGVAQSIIAERTAKGSFKNLSHFLERVKDRNLNKKALEALIKSGAMDEFGERGQMLANIELLLQYGKESAEHSGVSLFSALPASAGLRIAEAAPATQEEKLGWEKELLGLYISGHPLDKFRAVLEKREVNIQRAKEEYKEGMVVVVGGILQEVKTIITKKNEIMAFLKLADFSGTIEVVVFPRVWNEHKALFSPDALVALKGRISNRNNTVSMVAEKAKALA
ncbi:MAG: DNA polymerase III subunit alpha [Parcubacteria group bacterium Gr01-1014_17]|nr:MAG: DNA polymerase III subunit alpha [Parcubacteria group bacterium Gr01-1014_17]